MVESGRALSVVDSFTKEKTRLDEQEISYQEDEVFYKVVGGRKKGKVFGVGNADSLFFGPSGSAAATSAKSYAPGLLTQLQTQHEQLLKETAEKLNKDNEERLRQMQSQMEIDMMRKFEERLVQLSLTYNPRITPRSRDSHEDDGDTSSSFQSVV
ncbi:hypothetical protein RND81_04G151300 [Saponaria officinalis]|uniref:Uncharacterized protein n=1 Tax=Saponaria officinalis TaxID=3572 RepID=A0AAW1LHU3_SAPOF